MAPARDPEYDPSSESVYECLNCGTEVRTVNPPDCPECGGSLRNTSFPME